MSKADRILIATLKVISSMGYSRTTMSAVAKQAGIGKSTIYEYFDSKESLIMEATVYFAREFIDRIYNEAWRIGTDYSSILKSSILLMFQELGDEFSNPESFVNSVHEMDYCEETMKNYAQAMIPVISLAAAHTRELINLGQEEGVLKATINEVELFMAQRTIVMLTASFIKEQYIIGQMIKSQQEAIDHIANFVTKALS